MAALVSAFCVLFLICSPLLSEARKAGFSIDLIHRDSPKSPFYNPDETDFQRIANAFQRSTARVLQLDQNAHLDSVEADIVSNRGEYLMNISIGTPAVDILAIADTGSDLIWTQCKPCEDCFKQDAPLFDPKKSKTYKDLSCSASQCRTLGRSSCSDGDCQYSMSYGDQSYTRGNLAIDTVTLGSTDRRPVALPKTTIGCGHDNAGTFAEQTSGIVGLGGGPLSLISQLGDLIDGKFSYCLVPIASRGDKTSTLNFGRNAVVSGRGAVSTPLIKGTPDTFYYLNMEAISVNEKKIKYSGSGSGSSDGNIIIDSGTTLTILPTDVYSELESAISDSVQGTPVQGPENLNLCFEASSDLRLPKITAHFDGADVELEEMNAFIEVSEGVVCLAFAGSDSLAIYGNVAQMNFLVGYDTAAGTLSFKPAKCSRM